MPFSILYCGGCRLAAAARRDAHASPMPSVLSASLTCSARRASSHTSTPPAHCFEKMPTLPAGASIKRSWPVVLIWGAAHLHGRCGPWHTHRRGCGRGHRTCGQVNMRECVRARAFPCACVRACIPPFPCGCGCVVVQLLLWPGGRVHPWWWRLTRPCRRLNRACSRPMARLWSHSLPPHQGLRGYCRR